MSYKLGVVSDATNILSLATTTSNRLAQYFLESTQLIRLAKPITIGGRIFTAIQISSDALNLCLSNNSDEAKGALVKDLIEACLCQLQPDLGIIVVLLDISTKKDDIQGEVEAEQTRQNRAKGNLYPL